MKILFDLTALNDHLSGIERYASNLSKKMIDNNLEDSFVLIFKNSIFKDFEKFKEKKNVKIIILPSRSKIFFIQWTLYKALRKINADYYIFMSFTAPILFRNRNIINAIHDLTCWDFPKTIPLKMKWYYRITYFIASKTSKYIITVSKFSQKRIIEKYNLSEKKVRIIYDGLSDIFKEEKKGREKSTLKKYELPDNYFLSLSTIEPRKNIKFLIEVYQELIDDGNILPPLVLAGRKGWKLENAIGTLDEKSKKRILFTGFVDDLDLPELYASAQLFIFPSLYEGFGLPIIESMSQRTPVLCSDSSSLPEVVGNKGILFKSNNKEDLKRKILDFQLSTYKINSEILSEAQRKSYEYSWEREARKLHHLLELKDEY